MVCIIEPHPTIRNAPLTARELVTNDMLRDLAKIEPQQSAGDFSPERQATLSMILPDLCGELLARRAAMAKGAV